MSDFFVMRVHEVMDGQRLEYDVVVPVRPN